MGSSDVNGFSKHERMGLITGLPLYARELIAGGASGAFAKTAIAPFERIKILVQTRTEGFHSLGVGQSLRKIVQHEGLAGLYKGNGASVLRVVPYAAIHIMTYEQYRSLILNNCPSFGRGSVVELLAGAAAGGTAVLCTYPLDLVRTKLAYQVVDRKQRLLEDIGIRQVDARTQYRGIQDVLKSVYSRGGASAFYRGVGPTLAGILPYAGLKFYFYEDLKGRTPDAHKDSIAMRLSCGAAAGVFAQTFTYPLDVVRRRMQVQILKEGESRYRNTMTALVGIVRNHGWRHLYAGLSINYIKAVPSVAISFTAYDMMKSWLQISSQKKD